IGLLTGILRDVVELQSGRQWGAPDQFPIPFPHAAAEWLDVVNDLMTRRWLTLAHRGPDVDAIKRLSFVQACAGKPGKRRKHVHDMDDFVVLAGLDVAWPIGECHNARTAFVQHAFPAAIWTVVSR